MTPDFGLPEMTPDARSWLADYLAETCPGSRVEHLGTHAAFDPAGRTVERNLFAVIRVLDQGQDRSRSDQLFLSGDSAFPVPAPERWLGKRSRSPRRGRTCSRSGAEAASAPIMSGSAGPRFATASAARDAAHDLEATDGMSWCGMASPGMCRTGQRPRQPRTRERRPHRLLRRGGRSLRDHQTIRHTLSRGANREAREWLQRHRWAVVAIQVIALVILFAFFWWAFRDAWHLAKPLLREADLSDVFISMVISPPTTSCSRSGGSGCLRPGARDSVPGRAPGRDGLDSREVRAGDGLDPAARIAAFRRFGVRDTPLVLASMLLEAGFPGRGGARLLRQPALGRLQRGARAAALLLGVIAAVGLHRRSSHRGSVDCCAGSGARTCHLCPTRRWSDCSATTA